jgi:ACS family D-galactonate transporter-like MFS transporter
VALIFPPKSDRSSGIGQTAANRSFQLTTKQWGLLVLLIFSVHINYIDRGSLSTVAPLLAIDLSVSAAAMGILLSAFFWTYAFSLVASGSLVDRYDVKWVLGSGFLVWSVATLGSGMVRSFFDLLVMRMLLGIGESVAYPSYSRIIVDVFPVQKRGLANALIDVGTKVGPGVGTLIGGLLVAEFGWRALFVTLGVASLLWLPPWLKWAPRTDDLESTRGPGPGILQIVKQREACGTFIGQFCANYAWYFLLTWLPTYLVTERHYPIKIMAIWASVPFLASAVTCLFGGWLSDRWIERGADVSSVRLGFVVTGLLVSGLVLPAVLLPNRVVAVGLLTISFLAFGFYASNLWAVTQTLAGTKAAGSWTGVQNCFANFAGIVSPFVSGVIVSKTGSFWLAFVSASVVLVFGAGAYFFIVRRVEPVTWTPRVGVMAE